MHLGTDGKVADQTIREFCGALSSKSPTPGGGGASAVAGALGCSLGLMVISLTLGKKRYAAVEADLLKDREALEALRERFFELADEDERVFAPLAQAYRLPEGTEEEKAEKKRVMEEALYEAAAVPLEVMEKALEAFRILEDISEKGSRLAISDAGVGADYITAALQGASFNVLINAKSMQDEEKREAYLSRCTRCLDEGAPMAAAIGKNVLKRL